MIARGARICYDAGVGKFVHAHCVREEAVRLRLAKALPRYVRRGPSDIPLGLKRRTRASYVTEWERYVSFTQRQGFQSVPGRDCPWHLPLLWRYMRFRAKTCKPHTVTSGLSALAHFGARHGRLLATSKFDTDSVMYRQLSMLKRQLAIECHASSGEVVFGPNRCAPLGRRAVSLLLSAFHVVDNESFLRLSRANRHHLFLCVLQHSAAMRFGHFAARAYVREQFELDLTTGDYTLVTD